MMQLILHAPPGTNLKEAALKCVTMARCFGIAVGGDNLPSPLAQPGDGPYELAEQWQRAMNGLEALPEK